MNSTLSIASQDDVWETWRQPASIVAFVIIAVSIAIFAAVYILVSCVPVYSFKPGRLRASRAARRSRRARRRSTEAAAAGAADFDPWSSFENLSHAALPLHEPSSLGELQLRSPPPVWRPSMSSRLAWSFPSDEQQHQQSSATSPAPCASSSAPTVVARRKLVDVLLLRGLRREGRESARRVTWGI